MSSNGSGSRQITCPEAVGRLGEFLDRELQPAPHARLARHLLDCPGCAASFERYRRTVEMARDAYRSGPAPELPEEFVAQLVTRLRHESRFSELTPE